MNRIVAGSPGATSAHQVVAVQVHLVRDSDVDDELDLAPLLDRELLHGRCLSPGTDDADPDDRGFGGPVVAGAVVVAWLGGRRLGSVVVASRSVVVVDWSTVVVVGAALVVVSGRSAKKRLTSSPSDRGDQRDLAELRIHAPEATGASRARAR